jgi:hypothetical protein
VAPSTFAKASAHSAAVFIEASCEDKFNPGSWLHFSNAAVSATGTENQKS